MAAGGCERQSKIDYHWVPIDGDRDRTLTTDGKAARGVRGADRVRRCARVCALVLREHLVDRQRSSARLVLEVDDLRRGDRLAILGPRNLWIRVAGDSALQMEAGAVGDGRLGGQGGGEGGLAHQRVIGWHCECGWLVDNRDD